MDWVQVFVNLVLTGILLYVFQRVIDERSAKRLENFKTELQLNTFERQTKFSKLHERRAQVIEEIYRKLLNVLSDLVMLKNSIQLAESKSKEIDDAVTKTYETIREFMDYFNGNQLYLPETLCTKIIVLYVDVSQVHLNLLSIRENKKSVMNDKIQNKRYWDELAQTSTVLADKITPLIKEIEREFRNLLGS